mgnify:CR=1 FL=1
MCRRGRLVLLPAWYFYGEGRSPRTSAALVVGFAGLVAVALPGGGGSGAALSLLSAAAVTAGTLLSRRLTGLDLVTATAWHLLIGAAGLMMLAAAVEGPPVILWSPRFTLSLAFLALVGTAATTMAWFAEARRSRLDTLTAWTFLTPVLGIALASVALGERPGGWTAAGLLAVHLGHHLAHLEAVGPQVGGGARGGRRPVTRRLLLSYLSVTALVLLLLGGSFAALDPASTYAQSVPGGIVPDMSQTSLDWRDCATVYFGLTDYDGDLGESACGALTVPENWSRPGERQVELQFVVLKATGDNPRPDPVVYLAGGPGGTTPPAWWTRSTPRSARARGSQVDSRATRSARWWPSLSAATTVKRSARSG